MSQGLDLDSVERRKTVRLTTIGRRSGEPRTVTIWFVRGGPRSILVQHVAKQPAQWYRNLCANGSVRIDFGDGPVDARAVAIEAPERVREVVAKVGKKYWTYRIIRFFGGDPGQAVAAEITLPD